MTKLTLVSGFKRLALREKLEERARALFPNEEARRAKWVEAKLLLGDTTPKVRIGTNEAVAFKRALPGASFK